MELILSIAYRARLCQVRPSTAWPQRWHSSDVIDFPCSSEEARAQLAACRGEIVATAARVAASDLPVATPPPATPPPSTPPEEPSGVPPVPLARPGAVMEATVPCPSGAADADASSSISSADGGEAGASSIAGDTRESGRGAARGDSKQSKDKNRESGEGGEGGEAIQGSGGGRGGRGGRFKMERMEQIHTLLQVSAVHAKTKLEVVVTGRYGPLSTGHTRSATC